MKKIRALVSLFKLIEQHLNNIITQRKFIIKLQGEAKHKHGQVYIHFVVSTHCCNCRFVSSFHSFIRKECCILKDVFFKYFEKTIFIVCITFVYLLNKVCCVSFLVGASFVHGCSVILHKENCELYSCKKECYQTYKGQGGCAPIPSGGYYCFCNYPC